jgi:putative membrane protein
MDGDDDKDQKSRPDRSQQYLANERTFLAWVRTCIALIGLGFIVAKFSFFIVEFRILIQRYFNESSKLLSSTNQTHSYIDQVSYLIGTGIVVLAILLISLALKNYLDTNKSIKTQTYLPNNMIVYTTTAIIVILSAIVFIYLLYLPNS